MQKIDKFEFIKNNFGISVSHYEYLSLLKNIEGKNN